MRFTKKPVQIDAEPASILIKNAAREWSALPVWFREAYEKGELVILRDAIQIKTLEGKMTAELQDWVIRGIKGELYPCKPDIFEATYQAVV